MRFWLLDPWDALPGEIGFERGQQIVHALAAAGHEIVWWQTGFAHAEKKTRTSVLRKTTLGSRQELILLPARPYTSNVSPQRLLSIADFVCGFMRESGYWSRPDAILVSGPIFFSEPALLYLRWVRRIPVVYEFRDLWPETIINSASGFRRWLRWLAFSGFLVLRRTLFLSCDGIVGLNRTYLEIARREAGNRHNLLTGVAYPSPAAEKLKCHSPRLKPAGQIWIVSSGTLGASNDHQTLLSTAALLQFRRPEIRFLITGTGAHAEAIRSEIAARHLDNVDFLGALPQDEFRALLAECDIGLALYRSFSPVVFPTKIVDYMLAGLGVITSAHGEGAEILAAAGAGHSVFPENPAALADVIERCVATTDSISTLKASSARLAPVFAQDRQIQVIVDMLTTVVTQSGKQAATQN